MLLALVTMEGRVMRNLCYMAATCIAVFFYYVPAHSESEMQDDAWYDMCVTVSGKDAKWLMRLATKRGIKMGVPPRPASPGRIPGPDGQLSSRFLLPSQETSNFYNARMCRDHKVLSGILTAAISNLNTQVTVAGSDGPKTAYDPNDIRLEAVSILSDDKAAVFCSVTISAKGITERVLYSVGPDGAPGSYSNSWVLKFGGDHGPQGGGHELFPGTIQVRPSKGP
jgi:hypothetical protein